MKPCSLPFFAVVVGLAALLGCEPTIANRGNIMDPDKLAEIKVGTSTRDDVATKLGTPTAVSTFDNKTWYYIGRQTEQYSFLDPDVVDQKGIEVKFDDKGIVTSITKLDPALAEDIEPASGETPTYGRSDTFLRQLLGDLSHPGLPGAGRTSNPGGGT
jgi:outer membrane protein assembly factor BamE (lipoprotein component of BamABCDE complex)